MSRNVDGFLAAHYTVRMSRPFSKFRSQSLLILLAGVATGCTTDTIYSDVYSPKRSRFVPPVERTAATALPPETLTTTRVEAAPVVAPAPVEMAPAPVVEGLPDAAQPAPALPGMEAGAAPAPEAVPPADGQMMQQ